jgi:predicted permease
MDWRFLAFTTAIVGLTTVAFALAPALRATRRAQIAVGARATASRERVAIREVLVAVQVGLSVVLVSAAMLFLTTFRNLSSVDAGFRTADVLNANVFLQDEKYPREARSGALRELTDRLAAIPGVEGAAHGTTPPLVGSSWDTVVSVPMPQGEIKAETNRNQISAGYFRVLHTPLLAGRDFNERDTTGSPKVAVVNDAFARKVFGAGTALGQRVIDGNDQFEIVGVVGNSKQYTIREDFRPIVYSAASQVEAPGLTVRFLIRSRLGTAAALESVRRTVIEFDPTAAMRFATLDNLAAESLQRERLMASLSGFFGAIAIVLAAVGVYGVVSYTAESRHREIGIRLALGARARHILRAVLGRVTAVVGTGLLVGVVLTRFADVPVNSLLYGVEAHDPWILTLMVGVIAVSGLGAAVVPVRRALRTDPVIALRSE